MGSGYRIEGREGSAKVVVTVGFLSTSGPREEGSRITSLEELWPYAPSKTNQWVALGSVCSLSQTSLLGVETLTKSGQNIGRSISHLGYHNFLIWATIIVQYCSIPSLNPRLHIPCYPVPKAPLLVENL